MKKSTYGVATWRQDGKRYYLAWAKYRNQKISTYAYTSYTEAKKELIAKAARKGWTLQFFDGEVDIGPTRDCSECGNAIPKDAKQCPYCQSYKNPRKKNPASVAEMKNAYQEFHWGTSAKKVRPAHIPGAKGAVFEIGHLHAVAYSTYKRGQGRAVWEHKFGEGGGKKPRLVTDGKRLYVVGGTYTIRPEGITG